MQPLHESPAWLNITRRNHTERCEVW